jgi:hypothetical protein
MKFIYTLIATIVVNCCLFAQTNSWFTQKLDDKISIQFPNKPTTSDEGKVYLLFDNDSTVYTANVTDLGLMGLDSAMLAEQVETEEFKEQFKMGLAMQIPGIEIKEMTTEKWKGYTTYLLKGTYDERKALVFFKCVFINNNMYTLFCIADAKKSLANKEQFFNSVTLIQ